MIFGFVLISFFKKKKFRVLHIEIIQAVQNIVQMLVIINELLEVAVMTFF